MKFALLLLLLITATPLVAASTDSRRAKDILSKPEYGGYRIEQSEPSDVDHTDGKKDPPSNSSSRPRQEAAGRTDKPRREPVQSGGDSSSMGSIDPGILQAFFWILVAIAVLFALVFIVRAIMDRKPRKKAAKAKTKEKAETGEAETAAPAAPRGFPELEAQLAAALKAGDFGLATLLRYKLFWLTAGWRAVTDEQEVKTWRDALKLVRSDDLRREIRRLLFLVESVRYGKHKPDASEFNTWREKLDGIDHRAVLA
ncbi:hypothetical protein PLCT1_02626 [Planctomycetaceae bacterium]|nr:hypothetical protein PLCT1_02626 [Planctomycetaceae bacterium]